EPGPAPGAPRSLLRRVWEWLRDTAFLGQTPKYPSGSGIDSAGQSMLSDMAGVPLRQEKDPSPAPGDEYEVLGTKFNPVRIVKEAVELFRRREVLPLLRRLTSRVADRSGEYDPPPTEDGEQYRYWLDEADPDLVRAELGVELDDLRRQAAIEAGGSGERAVPQEAATNRPEPDRQADRLPRSAGEIGGWITELSDAVAQRDNLLDELRAAAQDLGAELGAPTADAVRLLRDHLVYQQARRIGALTGLAEAARRYNAEHADIPYSDSVSFFDTDPLGRFLREVVVAQGGDPRLLDWRGVNNGGEPSREWGDLYDSDQPGRDDGRRSFLERALRRDQIRDERAVWAQILGDIDLNKLDAGNLAATLTAELARIQVAAEKLTEFAERAGEFLRADAEIAELTGLIGDMAAQEWVLAQGGAMLDEPAGLALVPGSAADGPMRLVVFDARLEHDRILAGALARYPDLASPAGGGTVEVAYKIIDLRPGQPLPEGGAGPERITVVDAGRPRVRHFAGVVEGRQLEITVIDDGSGWRLIPGETPTTASIPEYATGPGLPADPENTSTAAESARRLGLSAEE